MVFTTFPLESSPQGLLGGNEKVREPKGCETVSERQRAVRQSSSTSCCGTSSSVMW